MSAPNQTLAAVSAEAQLAPEVKAAACSVEAISAARQEGEPQEKKELLPPTTGLEGHTIAELPSGEVPALSDEDIF